MNALLERRLDLENKARNLMLSLSGVEKQIKELDEAEKTEFGKNLVAVAVNKHGWDRIDEAASSFCKALDIYPGSIQVRDNGPFKGKALYLNSSINFEIVGDDHGAKCLTIKID
jgi:hypothetical protein